MALHLVRHAKAGSREDWDGDDDERPLSGRGWKQAKGLVRAFAEAGVPVARLLSSPAVRCVQTLEPLAEVHGLEVVRSPALAEEQPFGPVLEMLAELPDHSVLCSHGDIVPGVIDALIRRGAAVDGEPDFRKGARWELDRDGDRIVKLRPFPPPR